MKIVFPMFDLGMSGGNRGICEIANGLVEKGHDVVFVVPGKSVKSTFPLKARIVETSFPLPLPLGFSGVLALARRIPPADVTIATFNLTAYSVYLAKKGIPIYIAQHYEPLLFGKERPCRNVVELAAYRAKYMGREYLAKLSYSLPMKMMAVSSWLAGVLQEKHGRHCQVLNSGVNLTIFHPIAKEKSQTKKTILWVNTNIWWKGLRDCVAALEIVHSSYPDFRLLIAAPRRVRIAPSFDYEVVHPSSDEELVDLYTSADLFVHSSWFEGFSLPPLEAMACGTPVVATDSGGPRDYIVPGENALMVPPRNPERLAEAILQVLTNPRLAQRLSEAGLETALQFTWHHTADRLEKILFETLENNAGS